MQKLLKIQQFAPIGKQFTAQPAQQLAAQLALSASSPLPATRQCASRARSDGRPVQAQPGGEDQPVARIQQRQPGARPRRDAGLLIRLLERPRRPARAQHDALAAAPGGQRQRRLQDPCVDAFRLGRREHQCTAPLRHVHPLDLGLGRIELCDGDRASRRPGPRLPGNFDPGLPTVAPHMRARQADAQRAIGTGTPAVACASPPAAAKTRRAAARPRPATPAAPHADAARTASPGPPAPARPPARSAQDRPAQPPRSAPPPRPDAPRCAPAMPGRRGNARPCQPAAAVVRCGRNGHRHWTDPRPTPAHGPVHRHRCRCVARPARDAAASRGAGAPSAWPTGRRVRRRAAVAAARSPPGRRDGGRSAGGWHRPRRRARRARRSGLRARPPRCRARHRRTRAHDARGIRHRQRLPSARRRPPTHPHRPAGHGGRAARPAAPARRQHRATQRRRAAAPRNPVRPTAQPRPPAPRQKQQRPHTRRRVVRPCRPAAQTDQFAPVSLNLP
ncbi:hypothetical protein ACEQUB_01176 [Ralstonia syzygii]